MESPQTIKPEFDGTLSVATGRSRKEKNWENTEMQWSELLTRLGKTLRTGERLAEYLTEKKARQDEIKDVGGFVGGFLTGGQRKKNSVLYRQLITLDADFAGDGLWEDCTLLYGNAAAVYSTHKHSPEKPRLRLVLPLSRPADPTEYAAIARRIAGDLGIDQFDDTTYEPERLMYWPSTPADGEFVFEWLDGPWLDTDEMLATYRDWRDAGEWPASDRAAKTVRREILKQGDPCEKTGVVGAFCRAYDIREAIETFLPEVYEACDSKDRYTYAAGSASGGLVIYEDRFAFSHHGTDPASGRLCNAFDLVRIHRFGRKDDDAKEGTPSHLTPSFRAMEELALGDSRVKADFAKKRMATARGDFEDDGDAGDVTDTDWAAELDVNRRGECLPTTKNIRRIMENDEGLKGCFASDLFSHRIVLKRLPPWRKKGDPNRDFTDTDEANLRLYFSDWYGIKAKGDISDVLASVCETHAFHPVRDYLDGLTWDGTERLETFFIDGLGAEDSPYVRTATRKMLVAAVNRVRNPGAFMDYVMVFLGEEGIGKSKLLYRLAKGANWFVDSFGLEGKEAYENIRGKWIVEIAELVALKKADAGVIKNFLSKTSDFYRAAYARYPSEQPRQCVFFGSGNDAFFLQNEGGDRRFWPIKVSRERKKKNWTDFTDYEIDQLWAEAAFCHDLGESACLPPELEEVARGKQREHTEIDAWEEDVDAFLARKVPADWKNSGTGVTDFQDAEDENGVLRDSVTVKEIWSLCLHETRSIDYASQRRIIKLLNRKQDWEYKVHRRGKRLTRGWKRMEGIPEVTEPVKSG
jgi:predicted P-loop ATPase